MTRSSVALFLAVSLAASFVPALSGRAGEGTVALPDLTAFALMRGEGASALISVDAAADALKDYDVVFLGELHDHPANHLAEMALLRAIHARAPQLTLSLEMFERDVQPVLNDYMAGRIGEETLKRRGRAWGNYAESYRPLVEYAKDNGLPVIAANAPASVVRCVGQEGPAFLARMKPEQRGWAAAELHLSDGPYKDKFLRFLAEDATHGDDSTAADKASGPSPSDLRGFAAQVTRDDTMAESIFLHLKDHPGRKVIHVTGAFHVAGALGTVERLKLRAPGLKLAVVVPVEVQRAQGSGANGDDTKGADFLFMLRSLPKSYASDTEEKAANEELRRTIRSRSQCQL